MSRIGLPSADLDRRKQVRVRLRSDLVISPQKYEGKTFYVVKDPVSLRYWRFRDWEHFLISQMDGETTLEDAQKRYEARFRPERLRLEELEAFAQQLVKAGLARNESGQVGKLLFDQRKKRLRSEWFQTFTNILYIKLPVFDPDKILTRMLPYTRFIFTTWFFALSVAFMGSAVLLVLSHFETFRSNLPSYQEFFSVRNLVYMWAALGAVKVIHEFGHGLSCKAFGGEVHEMGLLFLCLSPAMYCNVTDSWTMPDKWKRIIISFAGIYVELIIAAISTFVWWNSAGSPFIHQLSLSLMVVCSVSTVVFNANPLMRYDGYYMLADWMEIPNMRNRANQYLSRLAQDICLGIEQPPEQYMEPGRRLLFIGYAVTSWIYRWVVTFSILFFLYNFLKPYKLGAISGMLAFGSAASMVGWPLFRLGRNIHKRGRLPDMKRGRMVFSIIVLFSLFLGFFLVPLPVARIRSLALVQVPPEAADKVYVQVPGIQDRTPGILKKLHVHDGQHVEQDYILAEFENLQLATELEEARTQLGLQEAALRAAEDRLRGTRDEAERSRFQGEVAKARGEAETFASKVREYEMMLGQLVLRAPRAGVVMSPPTIDEVGKQWDRDRTTPFCSIGEPKKLRVLMPLTPADYRLLKEDRATAQRAHRDLGVDIRVTGRGSMVWKGKIVQLPESEAKDVPLALTHKAGGPVPVLPPPPENPGANMPQNQHYLVAIDIKDPDSAICPGTLAQVKIHCQWKSCAWWVYRTISSTFDLGLL